MSQDIIDIESDGLLERNVSEKNGSDFSEKEIPLMEPLLLKSKLNTTSQTAIVGANVCPIESLDYE